MIHSRYRRAFHALCAALVVAGCEDQLPTAVGADRFPPGARVTSLSVSLPAQDYLHTFGQFEGYTDATDAAFLLAANQFDGGLNARILLRPMGWPQNVTIGVEVVPDTLFRYMRGELIMMVDTVASAADAPLRLQLREVPQAWDPGSATWEVAVDTAGVQEPWTQPGAPLGPLLSETEWAPLASGRDTLTWQLDSLVVRRMAEPDFRGMAVVASGPMGRVQVTSFTVQTTVRSETVPDTTAPVTVAGGRATFIMDRPPPPLAPGWSVGGVASRRVLFRVAVPDSVSACPPDVTPCPLVPLESVNVNEVALVLSPLPVGGGFRPIAPLPVRLRSVGLPELGRAAPLGPVLRVTAFTPAQALIPARAFHAQPDTTVVIPITEEIVARLDARRRAVQAGGAVPTLDFSVALLVEPEAAVFGMGRFAATPELRLVYTVPADANRNR
jgi:hypothetical protein